MRTPYTHSPYRESLIKIFAFTVNMLCLHLKGQVSSNEEKCYYRRSISLKIQVGYLCAGKSRSFQRRRGGWARYAAEFCSWSSGGSGGSVRALLPQLS